jgi:signal transduction histidine kinase
MMQQDITRLDRVANRFERIGRPPRRDVIDVGALAARMAAYFADRVPQIQHRVLVTAQRPESPVTVRGDEVLLEWVAEVLVKNAIDALGGRGGHITVMALPIAEGGGILRVQDDGPGVPRHMRQRIFDPGYSTKERGWGIGLALARRIVEENHGGRLVLLDTPQGATFDVRLPA